NKFLALEFRFVEILPTVRNFGRIEHAAVVGNRIRRAPGGDKSASVWIDHFDRNGENSVLRHAEKIDLRRMREIVVKEIPRQVTDVPVSRASRPKLMNVALRRLGSGDLS